MVVHVSFDGRRPSRKSSYVILTTASHLALIGSLSCVDFLEHVLRRSDRSLDVLPDQYVWITCTAAEISSLLGGP